MLPSVDRVRVERARVPLGDHRQQAVDEGAGERQQHHQPHPVGGRPRQGVRGLGRRLKEQHLALEEVDVPQVHALEVAERGDDDRQPHRGLGRRDRHDEDHEALPGCAVELREGHERQVHGVEHQLDAHEDDDRVAAREHADDADGEEDRREEERLGDHGPPPGSVRPGASPRRASTTAPTIAASSNTLVSSKATRFSEKSDSATAVTAFAGTATSGPGSGSRSRSIVRSWATSTTPTAPAASRPRQAPTSLASPAWPRFSSITTKRNTTMIAPAYTSTWMTPMKCASSIT